MGKTKKTEGCGSHWRPLGRISEHFTGLFRLTFISIAMDGSLQSGLTLWTCPLFVHFSFFFFFEENSKRWNVSLIWKYYFRLSSLPGLPCGAKLGLNDLAYKRTSKVKFEQCFCQGCWEEIVLDSWTVSLCSNNYRSRTNSLIVKRQSILEVATTTSLIPSISDLEEHITFTKSHFSDPSIYFCASHFYSYKSLTQPNLLGFMNTNELMGGGTQAKRHQTLLFSSIITHDCSSLKPSVWICENQR